MLKCEKCTEQVSKSFKLRKCGHNICYECLCTNLRTFSSAKIQCPVVSCSKTIEDAIIRQCLSDSQMNYYDSLCYGGNTLKCLIKDCPYFISYDEMGGHFDCPVCKQPNCVSCNRIHELDVHCSAITNYVQAEKDALAYPILKERKQQELRELNKDALFLNPSGFTCSICFEFILPRKGIILRNCLHSFCNDCLKSTIKDVEFVSRITCPDDGCNVPLDSKEVSALVNEIRLASMMIREASFLLFRCKAEDCTGIWHSINATGSAPCPICKKINCLLCKDIHTGMTCDEFRRSNRYISDQTGANVLKDHRKVECFSCKKLLIHNGGCGDMFCDKCGSHTCVFTGKISGTHKPKTCLCNEAKKCPKFDKYCNCTPMAPCHKDCKSGCIEDNH